MDVNSSGFFSSKKNYEKNLKFLRITLINSIFFKKGIPIIMRFGIFNTYNQI